MERDGEGQGGELLAVVRCGSDWRGRLPAVGRRQRVQEEEDAYL